jgi:hypothetical protein
MNSFSSCIFNLELEVPETVNGNHHCTSTFYWGCQIFTRESQFTYFPI